jgi:hypothetical protein
MRFRLAVCLALLVACSSAAACPPAGWRPDVHAAVQYIHQRHGTISFAVRTEHKLWGYHPGRTQASQSVLKAMLMVAYLNRRSVRSRPLRSYDLALLSPMIRHSDNLAALRVREIVGAGALYRIAHAAGMREFRAAPAGSWWHSRISAIDQTRLFLHFERFVVRRHRGVAITLLRTITPSQRWGFGRVQPRGWRLYFKGGWGAGTGAYDHQIALLIRGRARVSVAVLTVNDGTHSYGKETLRGVARRLLRGLVRQRVDGGCRLRPRRHHHRA